MLVLDDIHCLTHLQLPPCVPIESSVKSIISRLIISHTRTHANVPCHTPDSPHRTLVLFTSLDTLFLTSGSVSVARVTMMIQPSVGARRVNGRERHGRRPRPRRWRLLAAACRNCH